MQKRRDRRVHWADAMAPEDIDVEYEAHKQERSRHMRKGTPLPDINPTNRARASAATQTQEHDKHTQTVDSRARDQGTNIVTHTAPSGEQDQLNEQSVLVPAESPTATRKVGPTTQPQAFIQALQNQNAFKFSEVWPYYAWTLAVLLGKAIACFVLLNLGPLGLLTNRRFALLHSLCLVLLVEVLF
jgi:hypothetical protein